MGGERRCVEEAGTREAARAGRAAGGSGFGAHVLSQEPAAPVEEAPETGGVE